MIKSEMCVKVGEGKGMRETAETEQNQQVLTFVVEEGRGIEDGSKISSLYN